MMPYIEAVEERVRSLPVDRLASIGSFFVSRVDVVVDKMLDEKIKNASGTAKEQLQGLLGKAADRQCEGCLSRLPRDLQRPALGGAGGEGRDGAAPALGEHRREESAYRDILYAEELIGPDTVDTMGAPTIEAFRDHGRVRNSVEEDYPGAKRVLKELADAGIDMAKVTQDLQDAGIKQFADSFEAVMKDVRTKSEQFTGSGQQAAGSGRSGAGSS